MSSGGSILGPGDGDEFRLAFLPGVVSVFKATTKNTDGAISMEEEVVPPSDRPPFLHRHLTRIELFYVLEGELEFHLDGQTVVSPPGTTVIVPPGVIHGYTNRSTSNARQLAIWSPGGFEGLYAELAEAFPDAKSFDPERFVKIYRTYDSEPA